jgi:WD40 repeat protein/serine/threonine protein kinase
MDASAVGRMWRVGDVIDDLYEVRAAITSGGMGVVHRVLHRGWNMELAVKTPRPELASSPQRIADFEAEAETWVGLGLHPHVVACVYVRQLGGLPRVFAEWVDGSNLAEAVESDRLYQGSHQDVLARILDSAIQFAWGLDCAHSRGLVHQDVKPANAMLSADWTVKVTDFGLAKARAVAGETAPRGPGVSVLAGYGGMTPAYCSPEQASAAHTARTGDPPPPLTRATDVWSWAISVWEMFTGEPPCPHGQAAAEAFAAFREDSWVDDARIPQLPEPVAELLARCLEPDPAKRPRRMGELADELAQLYQQLVGVPYPRAKPETAKLVADGLNNQALSLLDLSRSGEAERLWQQVLAADPHHLHTVYNYGLHRWRTGQTTDTDLINRLEEARAAHPGPHADRLLAAVHLERHDTATARALLAEAARTAPHDRGIAEALTMADRQAVLATRALTGHTDGVSAVAVAMSAHGRIAISGSKDHSLKVWDLASGACLRTVTGHPDWVIAVAVAADVPVAVSSPRGERSAGVWDLTNGSNLGLLTGHTKPVWAVAVSADGRVAVSGSADTTVRVWDVASGTCRHTLTGHTGEVESVAVSVDGRVAVSASHDRTLRVWDTFRGACLHILSAHTAMVSSVAVSGDGRIAVSGSWDNTVRVWDLVSGTCRRTLADHGDSVGSVAVSADGRIAVSAGGRRGVRIWDLKSGVCLSTLSGHTGAFSVAVSADGRVALSGGSDDQTLQVWEVPTGRGHRGEWSYARPRSARELIANAAAVQSAVGRAEKLLANADGFGAATQLGIARAIPGYQRDPRLVDLRRRLALLAARGRLQDAWPQSILTGHADQVCSVAVSANGRIAISGGGPADKAVRVWDLDSGTCVCTLTGHTSAVGSVAVSADGRVAISSGSWDKMVRIWDLGSRTCLHALTEHTKEVQSVAISASGRTAVSGSWDKTIRVWDVGTGRCRHTLTGHTDSVISVAMSADGRTVISGSRDKTVRAWDLVGGICRRALTGHTGGVTAVAVSADGQVAISASNDDTMRVWDLAEGTCRGTLTDHTRWVEGVAVSADGRIAVSVSSDDAVRVWDLVSGTRLRTLAGHTRPIRSVDLSADATLAISSSMDQTVRTWALDWDYEFPTDNPTSPAPTI